MPVDIRLRIVPDTSAVREAVKAELHDLFTREAEPGITLLKSHIDEAVSITSGEEDHLLLEPAVNIVPASGELPVLRNVTFEE